MTRSKLVVAVCTVGLLVLAVPMPLHAQESSLEKSNTILDSLKAKRPDYIALIQDVSGSMLTNGMMQKARQAALLVVKEAAVQGTHVRIVGVNASEHVYFDSIVKTTRDRKSALDAIPYKSLEGAGTNLRKPHHAALRQALDLGAKSPVIVFVTDSYNDAPRGNPSELDAYVAYYDKGGDLTKIAKSPSGVAYRKDIETYAANGGRTFGFGVNIDATTHRPIERSPKDITTPKLEVKSVSSAMTPPPPPDEPIWPFVLVGAIALLAGGSVVILRNHKPLTVSIDTGSRSSRDLVFRRGDAVGIGGLTAGCTQTLPFAGNTGAIAILTLDRGQLIAKSTEPTGIGGEWILSVNGVDVTGSARIRVSVGDILRIRSVAGDTGQATEHRWKVSPASWERVKS